MRLRLVIFDVDGTLIDSQAHILAAMADAFGALGLAPPRREAVLSIVGLSLPQAMARLVPEAGAVTWDALTAAYKSAFQRLRAAADPATASPLYPGAAEALATLAARDDTLLGVATGKSRRGLDHVLDLHGLRGHFHTLQVADDHPSKPHPSMVEACLAETGVDPADAVILGDTVFDIEMGRAAGIAALGVAWGYHPAEALHAAGAARVLDGFAEVVPAIDAMRETPA